ncbi:MAG: lysylphosphatidylglycerol synthase transmembrane domain-containing protein [Bacillota bacterium]
MPHRSHNELLPRPDRVRLGVFLSLALNAAGLWVLAYILPSRGRILETLRSLSRPHLLVALVLVVISWYCDARRFQALAAAYRHRLPVPAALQGVLAGNFLINVTPFYLGAGLAHILVLRRHGGSWSQSAATVAGGGIIANAVQLAVALSAVAVGHRHLSPALLRLPLLYPVLGAYTLVFAGMLLALNRVVDLETRLARYIAHRYWGGLARMGVELTRGWGNLRSQHSRALLVTITWSLLYFLSFHSVAYVLWRGLGVQLSWASVMMLQIIIFILFSIVPTPGGSGALEVGAFALLTTVAAPELVGAFIVLWRSLTFYLNLVVGWVAMTGVLAGGLARVGAGKEETLDPVPN